jgi:hypothetical protein
MPISMADWKQITARIRRARTGKDPAGQLSNLFQKTRDAMVAFELAKFFETAGQSSEAVKWYTTAAERFRRADWKSKAQEAIARLGSAAGEASAARETLSEGHEPSPVEESARVAESQVIPPIAIPEPGAPFVQTAAAFEAVVPDVAAGGSMAPEHSPEPSKHRRRGRRGGRHRHGARGAVQPAPELPSSVQRQSAPPAVDVSPESRFNRVSESISGTVPRLAVEAAPEAGAVAGRARFGDPGLSSRLSVLEMQFRRLLSCPALKLNEPDRAPAGPGVFLLSDSELTTHYYVEDCQTLRIAIANLLRGSSSRRSSTAIKAKLAEHLEIAESRVSKYLSDHCVVRYLQLDEDSSHFAHFVIAVLRPELND